MPSPDASPAPVPPRAAPWLKTGWGALLGCLWLIVVNQLRLDWSTNPQYSYGWLVPLLAGYLFWVRWPSRPPPAAPRSSPRTLLAAAGLALLFLPTRLIAEASPEWSAVSWALTLEVAGLTLLAIRAMAGPATMRHFAWPICFFLVAVAWPAQFEAAVTQSLMHRVAAVTAELLSWAGYSAVARGNLIQLAAGVVGVDEACSGVRSLQSMLMASLFLGELKRFTALGRVALAAAGLGLALFFNLARALLLAGVAIHSGVAAIARWHDPAGFSILAASFALLCLLAHLFRRERPLSSPPIAADATWHTPPRWALGAFAAWLLVAEVATEAWYRAHEAGSPEAPAWTVRWPEGRSNFQERPISPMVSKLLAFNEGKEAAWNETDGSRWQLFSFRWYPGRSSTISARQHRPEACLPASGRVLMQEHAPTVVGIGATSIPFRTYQFSSQGQPLFVFFCLWETGNRDLAASGLPQGYTRMSRLVRVRIGQRNLGQQSAEFIISGLSSSAEAITEFRQRASQILVPPP